MRDTSIPRGLRPAFVATTVALAACVSPPTRNPPAPPAEVVADDAGGADAAAVVAKPKKTGVHPSDGKGRLIFKKAAGGCYVETAKAGPPTPDLMSGERWTENKDVPCPSEFDDPAFAAIGEGVYWIQDDKTGQCSQAQTFGNPPPPPVVVPCPKSLAKTK